MNDFSLYKLLKRLDIIRNFVLLEDVDELKRSTLKLKEYDSDSDINEIIHLIENKNYSDVINKLESFITKNKQLSIWSDPELVALKLELKNIENQINAVDNEKIELDKLLIEFQYRHSIELGEIILDILKLRSIKFKNDKVKYKEAKKDEKEYQGHYKTEMEKDIQNLCDDQKIDLKKKFRKATFLCHPDKFSNESIEVQKRAEAIFKDLNEANAKNDLVRVIEILDDLEKGILQAKNSESISDKDILRATIKRLRLKLQQLHSDILTIKQSETYMEVYSIKNWDVYFKELRIKLEIELNLLKKDLS